MSLTGNVWQKHLPVSGPEVLCIPGIDCFRRGYFRDPKGYLWVFSTIALEVQEVKQLPALPVLSEDPSVGIAEGQRTGAGRYYSFAMAAALQQLRLHDSYSQTDLSAGESSSDQPDHMASVKV